MFRFNAQLSSALNNVNARVSSTFASKTDLKYKRIQEQCVSKKSDVIKPTQP